MNTEKLAQLNAKYSFSDKVFEYMNSTYNSKLPSPLKELDESYVELNKKVLRSHHSRDFNKDQDISRMKEEEKIWDEKMDHLTHVDFPEALNQYFGLQDSPKKHLFFNLAWRNRPYLSSILEGLFEYYKKNVGRINFLVRRLDSEFGY